MNCGLYSPKHAFLKVKEEEIIAQNLPSKAGRAILCILSSLAYAEPLLFAELSSRRARKQAAVPLSSFVHPAVVYRHVYKCEDSMDVILDLQIQKDYPRAEEYYERAILASPGDGEVLSQYAKLIYEVHGDIERATHYYEQAVKASPEDWSVIRILHSSSTP